MAGKVLSMRETKTGKIKSLFNLVEIYIITHADMVYVAILSVIKENNTS
jgi:hypothetical protein